MAGTNQDQKDGFSCKLWRGEAMCLLGFDVENPEDDFVGFAIERQAPGEDFVVLNNRLAFSYPADSSGVTGARLFPSLQAPFQKFRWIDFPDDSKPGVYNYRVTKMHMPTDGPLVQGTQFTVSIALGGETFPGFVDFGYTRNFASSQAYAERFGNNPDIIPANADDGLNFDKAAVIAKTPEVYNWLGFKAKRLLFGLLDEAVNDPSVTVEFLAYDLNEPDVVQKLSSLGNRLKAVIDNSASHDSPTSAESTAAARLTAAGAQVTRTKFLGLQHHKVLILSRNGKPFKVSCGSTNFSFRGLYIQANNVAVFSNPDIAALYSQMFAQAFTNPTAFPSNDLALKWHLEAEPNAPRVSICYAPHKDAALSLNPVGSAIDQATSSVFYSIAFLSQIKSGPTHDAIARLIGRPIFSYGIVNQDGGLAVHKPDGSIGQVDFQFLSDHSPEPFKSEWQGGKGINIHHKFVVTDFNQPNAKVFMGSCNLSPSGEQGNGDNLQMIEDPTVATSYAIEALRLFDHLHFRTVMKDATAAGQPLTSITLKKPRAISGQDPWFAKYYVPNTQDLRDRQIFAR